MILHEIGEWVILAGASVLVVLGLWAECGFPRLWRRSR